MTHSNAAPEPARPHVQPAHAAVDTPAQPTDIKSFTIEKAPKSDQQFAAVVAFFYQFEAPLAQRKDSIDAVTMKDAARLAGRGQVKDWNMTLNNAMRAGYLDREERGAFKLSAVGENLVAITLPGSVWGGANNAAGAGKRSAKKKTAAKKKTTAKKAAKKKTKAKKTKKRG